MKNIDNATAGTTNTPAEDAAKDLITRMKHSKSKVRKRARNALRETKDPSVVESVISMLKNEDTDLRIEVEKVLEAIPKPFVELCV